MSISSLTADSVKFRAAFDAQEGSFQNNPMIDSNTIKKRTLPLTKVAVNAINSAYGINRESFKLKDSLHRNLLADTHWEVLSYSHENDLTNQYAFKAVTLINRHTKEIHIASAGTVPEPGHLNDFRDNFWLVKGSFPNKLYPLKALVDGVVQAVGGAAAAGTYRFSTSGHSLGAVVADLTGLEIASRGLLLDESITFENPGSEMAIQAALNNRCLSQDIDSSQLTQLRQRYTVYNATPNFINTTQPQFADHCNLVLPPDKKTNLFEAHSMANFMNLEEATVIPIKNWRDPWRFFGPVRDFFWNCGVKAKQRSENLYHGVENLGEKAKQLPKNLYHGFWNLGEKAKQFSKNLYHGFWNLGEKSAPQKPDPQGDPLFAKEVDSGFFEALSSKSPGNGNDIIFEKMDNSYVNVHGTTYDEVRKIDSDLKQQGLSRGKVTKVPEISHRSGFQIGKPCSPAALGRHISAFSDCGSMAMKSSGRYYGWNSIYPAYASMVACV